MGPESPQPGHLPVSAVARRSLRAVSGLRTSPKRVSPAALRLKNAAGGRVRSGSGGQVFGKGLGCIAYRGSS